MACAPEPQTRLTVIAGTSTGMPPPIAACRAGFILIAGLDHVAHDDGIDSRAVQTRPAKRFPNGRGAEFGCGHGFERPVIGSDRGADRLAENDFLRLHVGSPDGQASVANAVARCFDEKLFVSLAFMRMFLVDWDFDLVRVG